MPVTLAFKLWRRRLEHRRVFVFVDNDAARASLIKMSTDVASMRVMLLRLAELLAEVPCFPWFARVASSSNPGDAPSRLARPTVESVKSKTRLVDTDWLLSG